MATWPAVIEVVIMAAVIVIGTAAPYTDIDARVITRGVAVVIARRAIVIAVSRRDRTTGQRNDQPGSSKYFEHRFSPFLSVRKDERRKVRGKL
jgi:hypothetical protein